MTFRALASNIRTILSTLLNKTAAPMGNKPGCTSIVRKGGAAGLKDRRVILCPSQANRKPEEAIPSYLSISGFTFGTATVEARREKGMKKGWCPPGGSSQAEVLSAG